MPGIFSTHASERTWKIFTAALFIICFSVSAITPPFQSPDEFDHVKRAYLLASGQLILDTPANQSSGGEIDSGLLAYMHEHMEIPGKRERKINAAETQQSQNIEWSGIEKYSPAPGTGYYFPLIYAPQAIGLALARVLDLSVDSSYRFSRLLALLAAISLILLAFSIYTPAPLAAAMLMIPMSIFQLSSAAIDGVSTAFAILAVSCFLRIAEDEENSKVWHLYTLAIAVALVVSSRMHLLPLILLVGASYFYNKDRRSLIATGILTAFIFTWIAIAASTTVDLRISLGASKSEIGGHYLANPIEFFRIVARTIREPNTLDFYQKSFIGILGWLDAKFEDHVYFYLQGLIVALLAISIAPRDFLREWPTRGVLLACSLASFLLVFFAMLVTWSVLPAIYVQGVQGRYFLVPALMLAYAICSGPGAGHRLHNLLAPGLLALLVLFSSFHTIRLLLDRYYLSVDPPVEVKSILQASPPSTMGASTLPPPDELP